MVECRAFGRDTQTRFPASSFAPADYWILSPTALLSPRAQLHTLYIMSDFEDEMDIDAPPVNDSITFSSESANAKGKRSAANLPVEAEDSLPW